MSTAPEAATELPPHLKDLYDHVVHVLDRHLALTRPTPMTADLVEETLHSFDVLRELVQPLIVPQYDLETPGGRLMSAIAQLNQQIPGVALRTLWHLHEYLSTSDDGGIQTRERALSIIQNLGLPEEPQERPEGVWRALTALFPPLP